MDRAAATVHRHPHWPLDALQRQRDVLVLSCAGSVGVKLSTMPFHQQVERDRPDERQPGPPVFLPAYQAFAILKPADRNDDLILGLYRFGQRQFDAALRQVTHSDSYHPIANHNVAATVNLYPRLAHAAALAALWHDLHHIIHFHLDYKITPDAT